VRLLFSYLKDFLRDQFRWRFFLPLFAFLFTCFLLNYQFGIKETFAGYGGQDPMKYPRIFLFYLLPLFFCWVLYRLAGPSRNTTMSFRSENIRVVGFLLFAASAYAVAVGWTPLESTLQSRIPVMSWSYASTVWAFFTRTVLMLVLPVVWWWFSDRGKVKSYYGFRVSPGHGLLYLQLAGVAVLIALAASTSDSFSHFYPMAKPTARAAEALNLAPFSLFLIWESVYILQFVAIELFFRGFMVLGLGRIMGPGCIWIMASMYMFIHFSKPPLEAAVSLFAGILLGVLAYRTRSIYGGIVLHVSIAVSMDVFALVQNGFW
jgi:membrane protease YdiL (CAAX protease family)